MLVRVPSFSMVHSMRSPGWRNLPVAIATPAGVPVATMAVGKAGARNAAILAAQILAVADPKLQKRLERYKEELAEKVAEKAAGLAEKLATP